jgi:phospholipid/cholesterol/gamma-HCH transport system substrate-binding protein
MKWSYESRIGLVVFAATVIFVGGVMYLRGVDIRSKQYSLTVLYRNVTGLKTGDIVTVAGLAIGHVESMSLEGRKIAVSLSIKEKTKIPRDSKAILKSETIMGGKFIEIAPGEEKGVLKDGDSLAGMYEADLSELTATLAPISSNVLGILENVNSTFDEPTRLRIKSIVSDLARSAARLDTTVQSGGATAKRAFADLADFSRELSQFARTIDTIALAQRDNVDTSMTALRSVAQNLQRVSAKLEYSTESLNVVLSKMRNGEGTFGRLIYDDRLYRDLDSLSVNLNLLIRDIRENPNRYVHLSVF